MNTSPPFGRRARFAAAAMLVFTALAAPSVASASCALPPGGAVDLWKSADAVFVGTVTALANDGRSAQVRVSETWQGPDQPAEVVVLGGPEGQGVATSIDRTYAVGVEYLFAVTVDANGKLMDNACSGTTETSSLDLKAIRPADVRQPIGGAPTSASGGLDLSGLAGPVLLAAIVGGLLLVTVLLANRRTT